jgi:hypothetical protein
MASVKVLFILFDGAEWDIINPLLRQGRLPHLAKFMREGSHGRLRSLDGTALASPILWTSMASGKLPYKHGIKDFYDTANAVRCARLWEIFEHDELPIGLFGHLLTWPPRPTKGFIIPDWCARTPETFPPELGFINTLSENKDLRDLLRSGLQSIRHGMRPATALVCVREALREKLFHPQRLDSYYRQRLVQLGIHADLFVSLLRRHQPHFAVFYTGLPDAVHHQYWQYMEPEKFPSVPRRDIERYGHVIPEVYEQLDRVLERLLRETSPETLVVIASDHGGEANWEEDYRWADIHTENFIEALKLKGSMTAFRVGRKTYLRLRNLPTPIGSAGEIAAFIRQTVLTASGSAIFEVEVTGEHEMTVETVYLKEELEGQLLRFPDGRQVPVEQVLRLTPRISGNHSLHGILLLRGPNVKKDYEISGASLLDVVPTTLALVGRPVGRDMDGRALTDVIEQHYLETQPVTYVDSYDQLLGKLTNEVVEDSDLGMETVRKRLEDLGYID